MDNFPLNITALGLNSGSSMHAVSCALCRFRQEHPLAPMYIELLGHDEVQLEDEVRKQATEIIWKDQTSPSQLSELNFHLGEVFATVVHEFSRRQNLNAEDIDVIGSHGLTIWLTSTPTLQKRKSALTFGDGTVIASRTGITTVTDFRVSDQAAGRQGAPLAAFFDALLLHDTTRLRACQNIGGFANVTFIPPDRGGGVDRSYEFDTGPGTIFIDVAVQHFTNGEKQFDEAGEMGRAGAVHQEIVDEFLTHEFFDLDPPKTAGRETFKLAWVFKLIKKAGAKGLSPADVVASITRVTAQSIVDHYRRYAPHQQIDDLYLYGGGASNPNIYEYLQKSLPHTTFHILDVVGIPGSAKDAITFAWQAMEAIVGRSIPIPSGVETDRKKILGKVAPGENYRRVMRKGIHFGQHFDHLPPVTQMINRTCSSWKLADAQINSPLPR